MTTSPIRTLVIEDSASDAKLVARELERAGLTVEWTRVENAEELRTALQGSRWDVVISDWSLPSFSALSALKLLQASDHQLPLIVVSGTVGEDVAVEAMRAGARDFVLKDRLARLAPAVRRELLEREELRRSEVRFARLSESGIIGIAYADLHGNTYDANEAYLRMLGFTREQMLNGELRWNLLTPPEWVAADEAAAVQLQANGVATPWEKELLRRDGTRVPVLIGVAMLEPPYCITFVADLTERRRAEAALKKSEERLQQAQKMEAIGALAGGIAHDFNNLLSIILSYAELCMMQLPDGDPIRDDLAEMVRASERATELTRQLLAFSRQQVLQPRILKLDVVLANMEKMLRRLIGEDVELTMTLPAGLPTVLIDPGQLEQVVLNLAVNARDAMPRGGRLTIELSHEVLEADHAAGPGERVRLAVTDTGCGMSNDVLPRIFDPFFTTKPKGKGTGLGLATVHGIVSQSGGTISVASELGRGASFEIYFPCATGAGAPAERRDPSETTMRGSEHVLVVEDDAAVRALTARILERAGYKVVQAHGGGDALLLAEAMGDELDLVVTDVVMPILSGRELAERLRRDRPHLPVLFMSGYTDDAVMKHGVQEAKVHFLQKPMTPAALLRAVREALDDPR